MEAKPSGGSHSSIGDRGETILTIIKEQDDRTLETRPARGRGPQSACIEAGWSAKIEAVIEASLLNGGSHRKVWVRLRADGGHTAARRVRRIIRENSLLACSKNNAFALENRNR